MKVRVKYGKKSLERIWRFPSDIGPEFLYQAGESHSQSMETALEV